MSHQGLSATVGRGPEETALGEDRRASGEALTDALAPGTRAPSTERGARRRVAIAGASAGGASEGASMPRDAVDLARAREYALLATLLARPPDDALLERIARLDGDGTPLGLAHKELAIAAAATNGQRAEREYFELFIGMGRGELLPYASYYRTGFLHARPLAELRGDMKSLGLDLAGGSAEPEDHAAVLCEIMARLAGGDALAPRETERDVFLAHLSPWISRFFRDLEQAHSAKFYARVGALGCTFTEIETTAFSLQS
jgi:TorA maturation chaperone TorD